jgi:putative sterol carrier protein
MAQFLSDEWLDAVRAAAGTGAPGLNVRLEVVAGDTKFSAVVVDGELRELAAGGLPDADVSLTLPLEDAVAVQQGELAPTVVFMQGRMKTAGDPGKLLELLRATAGPGYAAFRAAVAASTTFSS